MMASGLHCLRSFLAEYETQFTLNSFGYLVESPQLGIVWGALRDQGVSDRLLAAKSPDDIWEIERQVGHNEFNSYDADRFENFIARYIQNYNQRQSNTTPFGWLPAPRQVWTFGSEAIFSKESPINKVNVYQITSFYDGTQISEIRRDLVREINVAA